MQNQTISQVSIKDYIVALNSEQCAKATYHVVLENNTDFIVSRTTLKTERELVILISQSLYYLLDKRTGKMESATLGLMKSFLKDMREDLAIRDVHWLTSISKDSAERIESVITNGVHSDMCRHNVLRGLTDLSWYAPFWEQNSKLFMQLTELFPTIADRAKFRSSIPLVFELDKRFGYNEALYFASQLAMSGVQGFYAKDSYSYGDDFPRSCDGFLKLTDSKYGLQLRRLVDYLLFDLYAQGIAQIDRAVWTEYRDYLDMQLQLYGKIREKYPAHLKTDHDVMSLKINELKRLQESTDFAAQMKGLERLSYEYGGYCLTIPTQPQDLVDEGICLSHCVGSYAERVIKGECYILFLRKTTEPKESLVTVQVSGNSLCQAQGKNRRSISTEERRFLERWCAAKNLSLSV